MHPLVTPEVPAELFMKRLLWGGPPAILNSQYPERELNSYVGTYLLEEIQAEGLTRSLPQFSRFLDSIGSCNEERLLKRYVGRPPGFPN